MNRRQYLTRAGAGISALPVLSRVSEANDHITVKITETNAPLKGGDSLDMAGEIENNSTSTERVEVDFIVGTDEEVVNKQTISIEPGETQAIDFLHFRTYPVREDDSLPVRLETETDVAERIIDVVGVDEIDSQYAYPDRDQELVVQPGMTVLFEVDSELVNQQGFTHWYLNEDYTNTSRGSWYSTYFYEVGREYFPYTFESDGVYSVDAAVATDARNAASRWEVTVTGDGPESPAVDASRSATNELSASEPTTIEVDVSSSDTKLDRVVWWMTQADEILQVSDVSGNRDTASIDIEGGCRMCQVAVWVIDENNAYTSV